jgi:hypothetical protein
MQRKFNQTMLLRKSMTTLFKVRLKQINFFCRHFFQEKTQSAIVQ